MKPFFNETTSDTIQETRQSMLWLPYVIITVVCLIFLAINFWFYHRKRRLQYERKSEVLETRERVRERRVILNMVKAKYQTYLVDDTPKDENGIVHSSSMPFISNRQGVANV